VRAVADAIWPGAVDVAGREDLASQVVRLLVGRHPRVVGRERHTDVEAEQSWLDDQKTSAFNGESTSRSVVR
jgi:hypothetical protein